MAMKSPKLRIGKSLQRSVGNGNPMTTGQRMNRGQSTHCTNKDFPLTDLEMLCEWSQNKFTY